MRYDYHIHSTYSDGTFMWSMLEAAEEAGLEGVGLADHCNVSEREGARRSKRALGFNLDLTYERRREAIEDLRGRFDPVVYDAVELDYDPRDEGVIRVFLDGAGFDYAIGSVHELDGTNVHVEPYFARMDEDGQREAVRQYYDKVVALVESGLFEIAAHIDLVERNPALRGYAEPADFSRVAEAFADSRTVPEVNAGRVLDEYGEFHPAPPFLKVLLEHDVAFTLGTDSHEPGQIPQRKAELESFVGEHGLQTVEMME